MISSMSFRRGPESCVIYVSTKGQHPGSGFRRSDECIAAGPIVAFDTGSQGEFLQEAPEADEVPGSVRPLELTVRACAVLVSI